MTTQPTTIYLKDYQPTPYLIDKIFLYIDLLEEATTVDALLTIQRRPGIPANTPLILNGEELELKKIALNGHLLSPEQYTITPQHLTIFNPPPVFQLETQVAIKPEKNTTLMGLYKSGGNYTSQCESHGFRRITYFLDRPDVLTRFTTTISADQKKYPFLLSNGNQTDYKKLSNNRHWAKWEDPSLKPCYLFALVAGDFDVIEDEFVTHTNRPILLQIFVEKGKKNQGFHAMACLKRAMAWDEKAFGREYDLDQYMVVAVNDFNFGAMENKGLNIFNDTYILAKPDTATDEDYLNVESVVGHEYFHNWSGNRITVRDWFQITLKEGLTVFREQSFMEDMITGIAHRIAEVNLMKNRQFSQDEGPMAHPIRPDHYVEVNNFYTVTVYNKGAEVIRMIKTLLGEKTFKEAMTLYFSRYDGQAVTTEDFIQAMMDASGLDLTQFKLWYSQAGTPTLKVTDEYDETSKTYKLMIRQSCPATPADEGKKKPFHIPVAFGLLDPKQGALELPVAIPNSVLEIKKEEEVFIFHSIPNKPIPSLLRNFSAPVKLEYDYSIQDLIILAEYDTDALTRWDAMQKLFLECFKNQLNRPDPHTFNVSETPNISALDPQPCQSLKGKGYILSDEFIHLLKRQLDSQTAPMLITQLLALPEESYLLDVFAPINMDVLHAIYLNLKTELASSLKPLLLSVYHKNHALDDGSYNLENIGRRALKNLCLQYLLSLKSSDGIQLALKQLKHAKNMTDRMGALRPLMNIQSQERVDALADFYNLFENDLLALDKWFRLQAMSDIPNALAEVQALLLHPRFEIKNPNKVRALIGSFSSQNLVHFHRLDGKGYQFLIEQVLTVDQFNPMTAARLIEPMTHWKKMDPQRQKIMSQLLTALQEKTLSKDLYEIVNKSLSKGI